MLDLDFSVENEVRGSAEGDSGKGLIRAGFEADRERLTAPHIDFNGGGHAGQEVVNEGTGCDAGPTGQGFASTPRS